MRRSSDITTERDLSEHLVESVRLHAVTVLHSPDATVVGRTVTVGDRFTTGRGRAPHIDLAIDDDLLSRTHLSIVRRGRMGVFDAEDLQSTNGSFVNGVRIDKEALGKGTLLRIGATLLWFDVMHEDEPNLPEDPVLLGRAPAFRQMLAAVERVAATDLAVLLLGHPGQKSG